MVAYRIFGCLVVVALLTARVQAEPGCPGTFFVGTSFIVPLFNFYSSSNQWKVQTIYPTEYTTSAGSISYNNGALVVTGYGLSATVAYTVNLADTKGGYQQQICSYQCKPQAGGVGDPHFTGFEGSRFDFNGVEGETYELLSTTTTLLTIQMVRRGYLTGEDGTRYLLPQYNGTATWIGAVGLVHGGAEVVISKSEKEEISVRVNGAEVGLGGQVTVGGLQLEFKEKPYSNQDGHGLWSGVPIVTMMTSEFVTEVKLPPNFSRRLDVSVERTPETPEEAEGIIGRTMANLLTGAPLDADITDAVWLVEDGNKMTHSKTLEARLTSAYQTSGLLASDALMTRFDSAAFGKVEIQPVQPVANSRRKALR